MKLNHDEWAVYHHTIARTGVQLTWPYCKHGDNIQMSAGSPFPSVYHPASVTFPSAKISCCEPWSTLSAPVYLCIKAGEINCAVTSPMTTYFQKYIFPKMRHKLLASVAFILKKVKLSLMLNKIKITYKHIWFCRSALLKCFYNTKKWHRRMIVFPDTATRVNQRVLS